LKRVLIVDDHRMLHLVLVDAARLVCPEAQIFTACDLEEALAITRASGIMDLTLLDLGLPGCVGLEALTRYLGEFPEARTVIVSMTDDSASILRALAAGAAGYIPKTHPGNQLVSALHRVMKGRAYIPPEAYAQRRDAQTEAAPELFTGRQTDILRLVSLGYSNLQIAQKLGISVETVKQHLSAIFARLGVSKRQHAVLGATRLGIRFD